MIGKMLKFMRKEKGLNQVQLSKLLNIAQTTLSGYETKYSNPTFETIEMIANECDFEIYFKNKKTKESYTLKDLERKDV